MEWRRREGLQYHLLCFASAGTHRGCLVVDIHWGAECVCVCVFFKQDARDPAGLSIIHAVFLSSEHSLMKVLVVYEILYICKKKKKR